MPIVQDGSLNFAALTNPNVYINIVPPQFLLNGVPSNVLGLVGSAPWGPVNSPQIVGNLTQHTSKFGRYQARKYDVGTFAAIAFQLGASAIQVVRVTDGTDVKATTVAQSAAPKATGSVAFTGQPTAAQTLTLNGSVVTFVASGATGLQVNIGASLAATLASLLALLQGSADTQLVKFTYAVVGNNLNLTAATGGVAGNSLTVATNVTGATVTNMSGGAAASNAITFNSKWTGSGGNTTQVKIGAGSAVGTFSVSVAMPGRNPEKFDNISGSGNAVWVNMAAAINNGTAARGPSEIITAVAGASTAAPTSGTYSLTGGTDGASGITDTMMLGNDINPRSGMYALRGIGCSIIALADAIDTASLSVMNSFGLSEGAYMICTGPNGPQDPQAAVTALDSAGIDSYAVRMMLGDYCYWNDTVNGLPKRLVSPAAFAAGRLANLSPEQSLLNKQINNIVSTEKLETGMPYTDADIQILATGGIGVITNPVPGGTYFGDRIGRNTSSNVVISGDNYTRMINFIASTLNGGMGIYVGEVQTPTTRRRAKTTLDSFLQVLLFNEMIEAFLTKLDDSNNPPDQVALGYMRAYAKVRLFSIVWFFIIDLEAGQSVTVSFSTTDPGF